MGKENERVVRDSGEVLWELAAQMDLRDCCTAEVFQPGVLRRALQPVSVNAPAGARGRPRPLAPVRCCSPPPESFGHSSRPRGAPVPPSTPGGPSADVAIAILRAELARAEAERDAERANAQRERRNARRGMVVIEALTRGLMELPLDRSH